MLNVLVPEIVLDRARVVTIVCELVTTGVAQHVGVDRERYRTITVERPERDAAGKVVLGTKGKSKGQPVPDAALRDMENVPLSEDVATYFKREVLPHAPDAWIDHEKTKVGYEIPFNRHFYVFKPPRPLSEIDAELKGVTDRILTMIGGLTK
jgi:type I restriction enzyme M protein